MIWRHPQKPLMGAGLLVFCIQVKAFRVVGHRGTKKKACGVKSVCVVVVVVGGFKYKTHLTYSRKSTVVTNGINNGSVLF